MRVSNGKSFFVKNGEKQLGKNVNYGEEKQRTSICEQEKKFYVELVSKHNIFLFVNFVENSIVFSTIKTLSFQVIHKVIHIIHREPWVQPVEKNKKCLILSKKKNTKIRTNYSIIRNSF